MERDAVMEEERTEAETAAAATTEAAQIVPSSSYVAIEFPGYVRNVARATRMLGGLESIAAAMCSTPPASFLKLSFRPEDPMAHPLFGNHEQTRGLVLRVSRPRRRGGGTGAAHAGSGDAGTASDAMQHDGALAEGDEPPPQVQVVAQVSSTYRYTGMADYQFLPLDPGHAARYQAARAASGPDQGTAPLPVPFENLADVAEPSGAPEPLLVVPPVFAKSDVPMDYAFKQFKMPVAKGAVTTSVQEVGFHIPSVPQPEPARDAPAEVPAEAAAAAQTAAEAGAEGAATGTNGAAAGTDGEAASASADPKSRLLAELSALLEQRPVWSRQLLTETLKHAGGPPGTAALQQQQQQQPVASTSAAAGGSAAAAAGQLQACLAQLTYRFKAGPWRHLYIRRGYDPRQQPESRRYQLLLYKLPTTWFQHLAAARAAQQPPAAAASVGKAGTGAKAGAKGAAAVAGDGKAAEAAAGGEGAAAAAGSGTAGRESPADAAAAPGAPPPFQPAGGPSMAQLHAFQELPTSSTTELQLCDLDDDTVRRWLAAPPADRCTEADGWFAKTALPEMQAAVNAHFQRLLDNLTPPVAPQQPAKRKGGRKSKKELAAAAAAAAAEAEAKAAEAAGPAGGQEAGAAAATREVAAAGGRAKDGTAAVPESREATPLAGPNEAAKPPSFLSTLMEQMALQHNAGQDDQDDEYKLLEDSGNEEDDDDEGPVVGFASGPAGLVPTGAVPTANGSLPHTAVAALGNGGVAASAEQAGEQGEEEAEEEEAGEGEFDEEEEEDYY